VCVCVCVCVERARCERWQFVVLRSFYREEEVAALRRSTEAVLTRLGAERQGEQGSADMFYGDVAFAPIEGPADEGNPHRVGYVNDIHLHEPALTPTVAHARLLNCLTELLGPDIDAWQVATVVKAPGLTWTGGGYGWHQVLAPRLPSRAPTCRAALRRSSTHGALLRRRAGHGGLRRLRRLRRHDHVLRLCVRFHCEACIVLCT
jgi:hypothetical protein